MSALQRTIAVVGIGLVATAVVGLLVRRRYRGWWFFALYLVAVLVLGGLQQLSPTRFHTREFWQAKETTYTALRFAMAGELAIRTFRAFPGALATVRKVVFIILLVILVAVVTVPTRGYASFVGQLQPRVLNGSIWIFISIAALILWYRVPVQRFYKAILLSYVPYIFIFTVVASYLGQAGWQRGLPMQYANQLAYVALLAYWNLAIWRLDRPARTVDSALVTDTI